MHRLGVMNVLCQRIESMPIILASRPLFRTKTKKSARDTSGERMHTQRRNPYRETTTGIRKAVGRYMQAMTFPSQLTCVREMLNSAETWG